MSSNNNNNNRNSNYVTLSRDQVRDLQTYLQSAHASRLSAPVEGWGPSTAYCHGEGRTASEITWHIAIWRNSSDGHHISAIAAGRRYNARIVRGSLIDHGTRQPSLTHVLNAHKRAYRISPATSSSSSSDSDNGNGGGGAGRGGSGQGGAWVKKVHQDGYGGYFYFRPNHEYQACDRAGNDIATQHAASYNRGTSSTTNSSYAGTSNSSYYGQASTPSTASTQVRYYMDASSGRRYYVDQYGRTQWA